VGEEDEEGMIKMKMIISPISMSYMIKTMGWRKKYPFLNKFRANKTTIN